MVRAKITSKGQITLPKRVRESLGLRPGDEVEFCEERGSFRVEKVLEASPFAKYRGYLKYLEGREVDDLVNEMRGE